MAPTSRLPYQLPGKLEHTEGYKPEYKPDYKPEYKPDYKQPLRALPPQPNQYHLPGHQPTPQQPVVKTEPQYPEYGKKEEQYPEYGKKEEQYPDYGKKEGGYNPYYPDASQGRGMIGECRVEGTEYKV